MFQLPILSPDLVAPVKHNHTDLHQWGQKEEKHPRSSLQNLRLCCEWNCKQNAVLGSKQFTDRRCPGKCPAEYTQERRANGGPGSRPDFVSNTAESDIYVRKVVCECEYLPTHMRLWLWDARFSFDACLSVPTCRKVSREIKTAKSMVCMDGGFSNHTGNSQTKANRTEKCKEMFGKWKVLCSQFNGHA